MSYPANHPSAPPNMNEPPPYSHYAPPPPGFNVNQQPGYPPPTGPPMPQVVAANYQQGQYPSPAGGYQPVAAYPAQPGYNQPMPPAQQPTNAGYGYQQPPAGYGYQQQPVGYPGASSVQYVATQPQNRNQTKDDMKDCCLCALCMALCCFCCSDVMD